MLQKSHKQLLEIEMSHLAHLWSARRPRFPSALKSQNSIDDDNDRYPSVTPCVAVVVAVVVAAKQKAWRAKLGSKITALNESLRAEKLLLLLLLLCAYILQKTATSTIGRESNRSLVDLQPSLHYSTSSRNQSSHLFCLSRFVILSPFLPLFFATNAIHPIDSHRTNTHIFKNTQNYKKEK
jgi:hypothetical protein